MSCLSGAAALANRRDHLCRKHQLFKPKLALHRLGSNSARSNVTPTDSMHSNNNNNMHNDSGVQIQKLEQQLSSLQAEIKKLTYLIQQSQALNIQTQSLASRAEARAYIIEHKLIDIQSHVVKIPSSLQALETMAQNVSSQVRGYLQNSRWNQTFKHIGGKELLTNKYTAWAVLGALLLFYQYRMTMYQRTSEEVANVAAMTLRQDSLRKTIQETLTTVANSPETLESLSLLFQKLIQEENTEQHLINLIVRALNSEGVKLAAIQLLDICFQNEELQMRGGDFLKIAATNAVLDEGVQKSAGVGIQKALKSVIHLPWSRKQKEEEQTNDGNGTADTNDALRNGEDVNNAVESISARGDGITVKQSAIEIER